MSQESQKVNKEEGEEEDEDVSVSPIVLEYLSEEEDGETSYLQTIIFPFRVDPNVRPEEQIGRGESMDAILALDK